jgi:AcrR family transcriptional regulator
VLKDKSKLKVFLQMKSSERPDSPSTDNNEMRKRILRAAFQSFTKAGYAGTSTLAIATRAKVSKRDLYATFPNKQAMLVTCITNRSAKMRMPDGLPEPRSREMLASTLTAFATNFLVEASHPDVIAMYRLAISEADRSPEIAQALEEVRKENRHALADFFAHAQSLELLPPGDLDEMVRQSLALLLSDLMLGRLLGVHAPLSPAQMQQRVDQAVADFLQLHPQPARKVRSSKALPTG